MSVLTDVVTKFGVRVLTIVVLGVVVVVGYSCLERRHAKEKELLLAAANERLAESVRSLGFANGEKLKSDAKAEIASKKLLIAYAAIKAKGGSLESHSDTKVTISDTVPGAVVPATPTAPATWADEHHRFTLRLPSGPLERRQVFGIEGIVVRSADGSIKATDYNFAEFDPVTKEKISTEGAKVETKFQFIEEKAQGPGPWRVRAVGGIDHTGSPAAGAQVNPWRGLTVGLLGIYSPKNKDVRGAIHVGWRLFGSTVSAGPFLGISSKGGGLAVGAAATVELTR